MGEGRRQRASPSASPAFAVEQLGDITLVNLDVKVGDEIAAGKAFGTIESVKTLSDLFAPVSGKVVEINKDARLEARARERGLLRQGLDGVIEASRYRLDRPAPRREGVRRARQELGALSAGSLSSDRRAA